MAKIKHASVDAYINAAPAATQKKLNEIRAILKKVAPNASEQIKWGVPAMEEKRILFSYAAFKSHLNFVPTGPAMEPFRDELKEYSTGKDSIKFSYDRPLPKALIQKIAAHRVKQVKENDARWMY